MAEKRINSRIIHKHDTEAKWRSLTDFVPSQGEVIIYDIDENFNYERIKIGDGTTSVSDLPFVSVDVDSEFSELSENPVQNKVVAKAVKDLNVSVTAIIGQIGDKSVTEYINDAVNDIQIGGRNLLLNTETPLQSVLNGETSYNVGSYDIVDGGASIAGEIVSLSFDWEHDGNAPAGMFYVLSGAPDNQTLIEAQTISSDSTSGHCEKKAIVFKVGATCTCVDVVADGVVGTLTISNMKLERGNQITDWTPAIEDMGALSEQNGYGIIRKAGTIVQHDCLESMGISVLSKVEPKQEGTGDPYPAGAGKNKLNITAVSTTSNGITYTVEEDGSIICNGTNTVLDTFVLSKEMLPTGNYRLLGCPAGGSASGDGSYRLQTNIKMSDGTIRYISDIGEGASFTLEEIPETIQVFIILAKNGTYNNLTFKPMIISADETDLTYAPYSNIRPIVGYDNISITRCGKNICPGVVMGAAYMTKNGTFNTSQPSYTSTNKFVVAEGVNYIDSTDNNTSLNRKTFHYWNDKGEWLGVWKGTEGYTLNNRPVGAVMAAITYYNPDTTQIAKWAQVEVGTTATAYEPYKGETYTISLGGTYYGGTLDVNRGELVVNGIRMVLDNNQEWGRAGDEGAYRFYISAISGLLPAKAESIPHDTLICSHYPTIVYTSLYQSIMGIAVNHSGTLGVYNPLYANYTVEQFKAELAKEPITIYFELTEPYTVKVDPQRITTLNGVNTVYSHDGSVVVDFNRDVYVSTVKPEDIPSIEGLATEDFVNSEFTRLVGDTEVSIQISEAMRNKAEASDLNSHTSNTNNPHGVTKEQIGLGNVENKSSETIRGELTKDDVTTALGYTPPEESIVYSAATQSTDGLMSAADKKTLDELHGHVGDTDVSVQITEGIKGKQDTITGAATSIVSSNLTQSMALVSNANGKVAASSIVTSTELEYLDGATSNIQKQLDNKAASSTLASHTGNSNIHITSTERSNWDAAKTHANSQHAPSNAQANQNAFSNVKVGTTTIVADTTTDTLTLVAGTNITLTPDATSDSITISASGSGSESSYEHPTHTAYSSGLYKITTNNLGHVTSATKASKSDITSLGVPSSDTNDYPTTWTWTGGTSSGPTASLSGTTGMTAVSVGAIPAASATASGIVTKGTQTFGGVKTFADNVNIGGSASTAYLNFNTSSSTAYSALEANTSGQLNLTSYYSSSYRGSLTILNPKSTGYSQYQGLMYQTNNNGTWDFNMVYHEGSLIASTTQPSNPVKGMIWLELSE